MFFEGLTHDKVYLTKELGMDEGTASDVVSRSGSISNSSPSSMPPTRPSS